MPLTTTSQPDSLPRAFLSHSSKDAELVREVARELGRPFVKLDYYEFHGGDEFLLAIDEALKQSTVFVLFASRPALSSLWVEAEVDSARYQMQFGRISKVIVCLLDDTITINELPSWMRKYDFVRSRAPKPIARILRGVIDDLMRERQNSIFVNRTRESADLQNVLAPATADHPPSVFAIVGLDGIGRRTILQRVAKDILSLPRILPIDLESGDSANDLAIKIADLTEPRSSSDALRVAREIELLSEEDAVNRAVRDLHTAITLGELPTLVDRGGLLNGDAVITNAVRALLSAAAFIPEVSVALVSPRQPRSDASERLPSVRLTELSEPDMRRLVALLARSSGLNLSSAEIASLAATTHGYPPSARFAVELAIHYGAAVTATQTTRAAEFRMRPVRSYFRRLEFTSESKRVLRILSANSPLPLEVLAAVSGEEVADLGNSLVELIDKSLVTPTPAGWYRIVDPIVDTVEREFGSCTRAEFSKVSDALETFLESAVDETSLLELARVRYRALLHSGSDTQQRFAFALAADWIRSAIELYHRREYEDAERVARAALEARPSNADVRSCLVRSLVKQGKYEDARDEITELRRRGEAEEAAFLEGFLYRHRGRFRDALVSFEAARGMGRRGVSLDRELANCYLELGDVSRAKVRIEAARLRQADNPFIIDMGIRIACYENNEAEARALLEELADVDEPAFHEFRKSRVALYFGRPEEVLASARRAVTESKGRPSFEIQAQFVLALAMVDDVGEAETELVKLRKMYPHRSSDVQRGLECRLQIVAGRFDDALATWAKLEDERRPVHLRLRRDALQGLLDHTNLSSARRTEIESEVVELDRRLANVGTGTTRDLVGGLAVDN